MKNYKIKSINLIVLIVIVSCFLFSAACRKTNKTFSETNRISTVSISYEEKNDNGQSEDDAQIIKLYSYCDVIDLKNEKDLLNSVRTTVNDSLEEEEFISRFIGKTDTEIIADNSVLKIVKDESEENSSIIFFIKNVDLIYPEIAYGLRFCENMAKDEALLTADKDADIFGRIHSLDGSEYSLIDYLKPLTNYQSVTFYRNEDNKLIKAEYNSDPEEYGTYNSTGVLYYDEKEQPILKEYYSTEGTRYMAYIYDDNNLAMICDFGGMAYKGLEGFPETEIGMDFKVYLMP